MAYYGSWKIDDVLTFCVNTHAADTGAATDPDGAPGYRVYENETATALLTGSMAKLDDASTIGFYSEAITLSAANGFEKGKCYTIYLSATVGGVTGTSHHNFQIQAEVDASVVSATNVSANVVQISGDGTAADNAESFFDGTGYAGTNNTIPAVTVCSTTLALGSNSVNASALATDAVTEIQSGLATAANLATVAGYLDTEIAAILEDTGTTIPAQISALNNLSAAQVNAEVLDVLNVDTFSEPSSVPAATSSLRAKIGFVFQMCRNKLTETATTTTLYADDGSTTVGTGTNSDSSGTFTRGEIG